ncbi:hypothetical protein ACH5RR_003648 [Cinchona calisaya]|uniref:Retrotransposon gag domain-containing protein n=1 Tax=Cinchona calisaya TaxID=153742 RepID=A0ABD3AVE1_9GENT
MKGNISNVRFTSMISSHPPFSHNWPKFVPQPSEEPFVLYLLDSPLSRNLIANHHVVKDPMENDINFESLCLSSDVKVPQNSKISNFSKYGGGEDPLTHVTIFCNELGAYGNDERLRICLFQRSLCSDVLQWFTHLNRSELQSWNSFIRAFFDTFQLVNKSILDWIDLIDMKRRQHESFGKYAPRWRNAAVKVEPPMTERELVKAFIRTLEKLFHEKVLGLLNHRFW